MNYADLFTATNGFPLESDATLGFMQSDYQSAIVGLAKLAGLDNIIISGCVDAGATVGDGWILYDGDLVRFLGGAKLDDFVIVENWVQKANQDGTLYDRYLTKYATFGSGGSAVPFSDLQRLDTIESLRDRLLDLILWEDEVILKGCEVTDVDGGAETLEIATGIVVLGRKFISAPAYSGDYPVYLGEDGAYSTSVPGSGAYITFDPYTSQRIADVYARATSPEGDIRMRAVLSDRLDNTGLGQWELLGWALCNGSNGTFDLRGRFPIGYDNRNSDPANGIWDVDYNTVGETGGEKAHTLVMGEMPKHTHTGSASATGAVTAGNYGVVKRSNSGDATTTDTVDATGSGTEPDVLNPPFHLPAAGNDQPHENRPPYKVIVFIQRIV